MCLLTSVLQVITSTVRPQKCMNPATSTMVAATQKMTNRAPRKLKLTRFFCPNVLMCYLPRKSRTVRNMASMEEPIFW